MKNEKETKNNKKKSKVYGLFSKRVGSSAKSKPTTFLKQD